MKNSLIVFSTLILSMSAFADEYYKCYSVKKSNMNQEVSMRIATASFSKKITAVDLISKISNRKFDEMVNPYSTLGMSADRLDPESVEAAEKLTFKKIVKQDGKSSQTIALSQSLLNFENNGYAYYHAESCFWILDCSQNTEFFKCDKI